MLVLLISCVVVESAGLIPWDFNHLEFVLSCKLLVVFIASKGSTTTHSLICGAYTSHLFTRPLQNLWIRPCTSVYVMLAKVEIEKDISLLACCQSGQSLELIGVVGSPKVDIHCSKDGTLQGEQQGTMARGRLLPGRSLPNCTQHVS